MRTLVRVLTRALQHLDAHHSPTHKRRDESYLDQGPADPAEILCKCDDESVGEGPRFRIPRMPLLAPTMLSSLTTETPESV